MKQKLLFCLLFLLTTVNIVWAQERTITGKVTDAETREVIPGVSVFVKGTTIGTVTDANGQYSIMAPVGSMLVFQAVGLMSQEMIVGSENVIDLQMQSDVKQLNEIVVSGYGGGLEKREITGAISSVKGAEIQNLPLQSFDKAMQGRAAGVQILAANGTPGGAVQVRIRGIGSISAGSEPLYIVDGVQLNSRNDGGGNVSSNPLSFLNPNDIESIDVLKDAANAAIYGAQAANGVVIVTTKKGKSGAKTNFSVSYYRGINEPIKYLNVMNTQQYIQTRTEAISATSIPASFPDINSVKSYVLETELGFSPDLTDAQIAALPTYDWQKVAYKNGIVDNYEISASGGNDKTTFYVSTAYNKQDASLINVDFKRLSGRLSLTHKVNSKLSFETGLNLSTVTQRRPYGSADGTTAFGAPQYSSPLILPSNPIYNTDGSYFGLPASGQLMSGDISFNVVASSNYVKIKGLTNQIVGNFAVNYEIIKGLNFKGFVGIDYRLLKNEFFGDPRLQDYIGTKGFGSVSNNYNTNITTNYTLNYAKTFAEKHNFSALLGTEYRQEVQESNGASAQGFPSPDFQTLNAAALPLGSNGFWTSFKRAGVFTNIRYDFAKKYLLSLVLRYDGSSRFGANNKFGWFPSISAAWNLHEENFLKDVSFLNDLRLRASWGTTGNDQIGNFSSRNLYSVGGVYDGATGVGPGGLGSPDLRWEKNQTTNLGLDFAIFSNRLRGSVEVYRRVSKDLLLNRSLPGVNGFTSITENIGEVVNKGLEITLNSINLDVKGFKWETNFNISFLDNKVTKLLDGVDVLPGNLGIRVGYPINTNVGVPYAGVNPANGRPMWYDLNGNVTYLVLTSNQRPLGHANISTMYGGFTNNFSYKGIELAVFFQYDYGRTALNSQELRFADLGGAQRNGLVSYFDERWTTPGQITSVPRAALNRTLISGRISSYQSTSRFYQDASFIRLKQITLSYTLPQNWIRRAKLTNVKVYAQAVNLFTWTKWTGYDPEFVDTANNGTSNQGVIPQSRNYTFGVQFGF